MYTTSLIQGLIQHQGHHAVQVYINGDMVREIRHLDMNLQLSNLSFYIFPLSTPIKFALPQVARLSL